MAVGIRPGEIMNAKEVYADIINIFDWEPNSKHPRMSPEKRAAQFAPFAALSGFDEMVKDLSRQTVEQIEPGEEEKALLNRKMNRLSGLLKSGAQPEAAFTYFVPDKVKSGGKYVTVTARVRRIDTAAQKFYLVPSEDEDVPEALPFDKISAIAGEAVDDLDDTFWSE